MAWDLWQAFNAGQQLVQSKQQQMADNARQDAIMAIQNTRLKEDIADRKWNQNMQKIQFENNAASTQWQQNYQTGQADTAKQNYDKSFNEGKREYDLNFKATEKYRNQQIGIEASHNKATEDYNAAMLAVASQKEKLGVVNTYTGQTDYMTSDEYIAKRNEGYYPGDSWTPMDWRQASVYNQKALSKNGTNKDGLINNPAQILNTITDATSNVNADWVNRNLTSQKVGKDGKVVANDWESNLSADPRKSPNVIWNRLKAYNQYQQLQKESNAKNLLAYIKNTVQPMALATKSMGQFTLDPKAKTEIQNTELQFGAMSDPLLNATQAFDKGLIADIKVDPNDPQSKTLKQVLWDNYRQTTVYMQKHATQLSELNKKIMNSSYYNQLGRRLANQQAKGK